MKDMMKELSSARVKRTPSIEEHYSKKALESFYQKVAFKINEGWNKEDSHLYKHAMHELKIAGLMDKDSDYGGMLGDAVLAIVEVFAKQGHSGMSAAMTIALLEKLLRFENLTPITNNPEDWMHIADERTNGISIWQCRRNCALFSNDGGKTYYSVDDPERKIQTAEPYKAKA